MYIHLNNIEGGNPSIKDKNITEKQLLIISFMNNNPSVLHIYAVYSAHILSSK